MKCFKCDKPAEFICVLLDSAQFASHVVDLCPNCSQGHKVQILGNVEESERGESNGK